MLSVCGKFRRECGKFVPSSTALVSRYMIVGSIIIVDLQSHRTNSRAPTGITMWIDDLDHGIEAPNSYKISDVDECSLCYDMIQNPQQIRGCGHVFCGACIEDDIIDQTARDDVS
jgi:hypothetical protein